MSSLFCLLQGYAPGSPKFIASQGKFIIDFVLHCIDLYFN